MFHNPFFGVHDKKLAVLVDPEKSNEKSIRQIAEYEEVFDFFLVGGSSENCPVDAVVQAIKTYTGKPVILFPASHFQLTAKADALLFLSLISGRNPEFLIGQQVAAASFIKTHRLLAIPTGYILIDGGKISSVEKASRTKALPASEVELIVSTALAGELLGMQSIYLEAGSGALRPVPLSLIAEVKKNISVPLIAGGGIRSNEQLHKCWASGADVVVIGNAIEEDPHLLRTFTR